MPPPTSDGPRTATGQEEDSRGHAAAVPPDLPCTGLPPSLPVAPRMGSPPPQADASHAGLLPPQPDAPREGSPGTRGRGSRTTEPK